MIGVSTDLPTPPDTPDVPDTPDTPDSPSGNVLATFTFGDNKSAAHNDGVNKTAKTYTENDYTLNITGGTQLYVDANDAKGNSCLKLGSSKNVGSFSFTVPSDVTSVVFEIAKYKANNSAVKINGTVCTPTVNSNDGQYDSFTVDTSSAKTVSVETVSGTTRVMINSITFLGASEPIVPDEPDTPITPDEPDTPITPDEPDTPITPDASDSGSIGDSTNGTVGGSTSDVISGLIEAGCAATLGSSAILALLPVAVFLYKKKEH